MKYQNRFLIRRRYETRLTGASEFCLAVPFYGLVGRFHEQLGRYLASLGGIYEGSRSFGGVVQGFVQAAQPQVIYFLSHSGSVAGYPVFRGLRDRGFNPSAAFVALGRRLARVYFGLLENDSDFNANLHLGACAST
ncbi:MAG: hypothetical protein O7H39_10460 [Gammaproteobacteria bacterium]|nr:hypothetical protein [Gammaproteobacteria bacterium]